MSESERSERSAIPSASRRTSARRCASSESARSNRPSASRRGSRGLERADATGDGPGDDEQVRVEAVVRAVDVARGIRAESDGRARAAVDALEADGPGRDRGTGDETERAHGVLDEVGEARRALAGIELQRDGQRAAAIGLAAEARRHEQARLGPAGRDVTDVGAHERDAAAEVDGRLAHQHADQRRHRVVEVAAAGDAAVERAEDGVEGLVRALEAVLALGDLDRQRPHHRGAQRLAVVDAVADVQARVLDGARRGLEQRERAARIGQGEDERAALVQERAVERPVAVERGLAALVRVEHERHLAPVREIARGQGEGGLHEAQERLSQLPVEHSGGRDEDAVHADAVRARPARSCRPAPAERSRCRLASPAHSP